MLILAALAVVSTAAYSAPSEPPARATAPTSIRGTANNRVTDSLIQIGIVQQSSQMTLRPQGNFSIIDQATGESHVLENLREYLLKAEPGNFTFGPYRFEGQLRLLPKNPQSYILVGEKKYRGNLIVKPNADLTFTVVDELGLEEYLYGVLSAEVGSSWPMEALKAQAVVARTFALANMGRFEASGFDLSNDSRSQVYADSQKHFPDAIIAVHETEGQVLKWRGQLLPVHFHSCCGGHTTDANVFWGFHGRFPRPLKGVPDPYCKAAPYYDWTAYFSNEDILRALPKTKLPVADLRSIRIGSRDRAGFVKNLYFYVGRKSFTVRANDFRNWIGNTELKSTKITRIVKKSNGFIFTGRGFGHGVGLCQWGAKSMAERGKDYRQILKFYFPQAALARHDE